MPQWLCNQLRRAFLGKNRKQIRLLNDCWFFYHNRIYKLPGEAEKSNSIWR
ncbi:cortex morphogenetic protein CmpA [Paenibacillus cymbidii]|uniref:cortex morphogenetic protein CmpA n=1 Tax=Paenibacillus cymbidii TaxID=1639034 RepID=UPI0010817244|nr:cortex morphogenetic protein CmpA [Paenibacillus cymbidii]